MNSKRLTMHTPDGACLILRTDNEQDARQELKKKFKEACNKLAELEDKLENGTLIEIPCKAGDTVYVIYDKYVTSAKVLAFYIDQIGGMFDLRIKTNNETGTGFKTVLDTNNYTFENVFFTKEEAEKALANKLNKEGRV